MASSNPEIDDDSPIEQVRVTVPTEDDPTLPIWTFRVLFLGLLSCTVLSFLNTFFSYRNQALVITMVVAQVASLPAGRLMAKVLPTTKFHLPGFGSREFSFNPGPFNMKEHVLISIFANAGSSFGSGPAYAVGIYDIVKVFYMRNFSWFTAWVLVITTQVLGYGWAGLMRKYVIEPAEMWWPGTLMQVSLFRALHEPDNRNNSRTRFFLIALVCSFAWYTFPGYLIPFLSSISIVCLAYPKSVNAHIVGSGLSGLGIGSFTLDWNVISSFLGNPLVNPFFSIVNFFIGYVITVYLIIPVGYWGADLYNARRFPYFASDMFDERGQIYDFDAVLTKDLTLDVAGYEKQGRLNLSLFFALTYGLNFAAVTATVTHVALFYGKSIYQKFRASTTGKQDIHTRLMAKYKDIPTWWFYVTLLISFAISLLLCIFKNHEVQLPWWGLIFACGLALAFTLPISIIYATTNQSPGLNVITEYLMGYLLPGRPIANVCFKTYGYISMAQAISFLSDFKLGHYMKIPPRSMFMAQLTGTILAGTVNMGVAYFLISSVKNICHPDLLPEGSPWTCQGDRVFFDASVIWGLVGPKRMFGPLGNYNTLNWGFLLGAVLPFLVWLLHRAYPDKKWIPLINFPILLGATAVMPPAGTLNVNSWALVGTIFNFFIYRYRSKWWQRYNYVLAAALDAGVAFMSVLIYFATGLGSWQLSWWGSNGEHCDLAGCPTAKGIVSPGCPVF